MPSGLLIPRKRPSSTSESSLVLTMMKSCWLKKMKRHKRTPSHPVSKPFKPRERTNKHKVKWHDTEEASYDQTEGTTGFHDTTQGNERDFRPRKTLDDLPQSHSLRRKKVSRDLMRKHLLSTATLMTLIKSAGNPAIDSGENVMGLSKYVHPLANVFDPNDPQHILETNWYCQEEDKWTPAVISNIKATIDHDLFEGAKDLSFEPSSVLDHRVTKVLVRKMEPNPKPTIKLIKSIQVRVKVLWKNGEISWINANTPRLQNPYHLVARSEERR